MGGGASTSVQQVTTGEANLMLQGPTDKVGQGMQESPLAKARHRLPPAACSQHGGLPLGRSSHA